MPSPISSILRASKEKTGQLNILTAPTHERYETGLCLTGHNFYAFRGNGIKDWSVKYGKIPSNYTLLDKSIGMNQIPNSIDFDLILSQNKFGQYQALSQLARYLHLPIVSLEHTLPMTIWTQEQRIGLANMRGHINVFISEYSIGQWQWTPKGNDTRVIHHMVDTEVFYPEFEKQIPLPRENRILSVVNDWINRDWCCGFNIWRRVSNGLPVYVIGDTPGLSKPASSTKELADAYRKSRIFLNTSTISPIPTALLEAMACGCACVSTATCMIPEIIENGVNGFISNDESELRKYCEILLKDEDLAYNMGKKAYETIISKFHRNEFVNNWNNIFYEAANIPYLGDI